MSLFKSESVQEETSAKRENHVKPAAETFFAVGEDFEALSFGHYRLERELGRGFSSIVYAAHDDRRHRTVALKVLTFLRTPDEERQRELEERFRREAQAISTLSHPNIVAIYDVGGGDDCRQFIAMEYLPGETLRRRLDQAAPLSVPETVNIGIRVAEALHYAHGRGIIHRDVKPDNIFLAHNGAKAAMPKLMDFGIAHVLSEQALTQDGEIVGSPAYMSPEQIHGMPVDARTDVFSLAVTLTEMATGIKPFEAETIPAVMQKILRHAPNLRAVADRPLQRVLAKALAKNPAGRYLDAEAFAQALRQTAKFGVPAPSIATQHLTHTALDDVPARPRRLARLGVIGLGVAGLGGLAFASLAALPFWTAPAPHASPTAPAYPAESSSRRASVNPTNADSPRHPRTIRLADVRATRQEYTSVQSAASARLLSHAWGDGIVRIQEVRPRWGSLSPHFGSARISRVFQSPQPPATHLASGGPTAPAKPVRSNLPHWNASPRPVPYRLETSAPKPMVRVAASREERTPSRRSLPPPATTFPDAPPRPLSRPMPRLMDSLEQTDAVVRLRLSVSEDGDVTDADILNSSGSRALDDAALDAVGHWRYAPAVQDGQPVPASVTEIVKFVPRPAWRKLRRKSWNDALPLR